MIEIKKINGDAYWFDGRCPNREDSIAVSPMEREPEREGGKEQLLVFGLNRLGSL